MYVSSHLVYCYECSTSITSSDEGLKSLIRKHGDYYTCRCGNKIKLRLTKYDMRKFKLRKIKTRIA